MNSRLSNARQKLIDLRNKYCVTKKQELLNKQKSISSDDSISDYDSNDDEGSTSEKNLASEVSKGSIREVHKAETFINVIDRKTGKDFKRGPMFKDENNIRIEDGNSSKDVDIVENGSRKASNSSSRQPSYKKELNSPHSRIPVGLPYNKHHFDSKIFSNSNRDLDSPHSKESNEQKELDSSSSMQHSVVEEIQTVSEDISEENGFGSSRSHPLANVHLVSDELLEDVGTISTSRTVQTENFDEKLLTYRSTPRSVKSLQLSLPIKPPNVRKNRSEYSSEIELSKNSIVYEDDDNSEYESITEEEFQSDLINKQKNQQVHHSNSSNRSSKLSTGVTSTRPSVSRPSNKKEHDPSDKKPIEEVETLKHRPTQSDKKSKQENQLNHENSVEVMSSGVSRQSVTDRSIRPTAKPNMVSANRSTATSTNRSSYRTIKNDQSSSNGKSSPSNDLANSSSKLSLISQKSLKNAEPRTFNNTTDSSNESRNKCILKLNDTIRKLKESAKVSKVYNSSSSTGNGGSKQSKTISSSERLKREFEKTKLKKKQWVEGKINELIDGYVKLINEPLATYSDGNVSSESKDRNVSAEGHAIKNTKAKSTKAISVKNKRIQCNLIKESRKGMPVRTRPVDHKTETETSDDRNFRADVKNRPSVLMETAVQDSPHRPILTPTQLFRSNNAGFNSSTFETEDFGEETAKNVLDEMMRCQIYLTKYFVESHHKMYLTCCRISQTLNKDYKKSSGQYYSSSDQHGKK